MVSVDLGHKVNVRGRFVVRDDRDVAISLGHKVAPQHVVILALRIAAQAGARGGPVEVGDRVVDVEAGGWKVARGCDDGAGVEAVGAVVDDWGGDDVQVGRALLADEGTALAGLAHHAVAVDGGEEACEQQYDSEREHGGRVGGTGLENHGGATSIGRNVYTRG